MTAETPDGAILQRDKETWAVVPRTPCGLLTPEFLENLAAVVRKYHIPTTKITSGHRLALIGVKSEEIEAIRADLNAGIGRAMELCLHYVQACPGNSVCSLGVRDSLSMGQLLEQRFAGVELPAKLKIGVSGCPMCCAEGYVRDIGLIGKRSGWIVTFGGNSGGRPRMAEVVAEGLDDEQAVSLVDKLVEFYRQNGKKKERTARMAERLGLAAIQAAISA